MTGLLLSSRSSQADFEVPLVETTNYVATDFRGLAAFYRSNWNGFSPASNQEYYEAWAAGKYYDATLTIDAAALYRWAYNDIEDKYQWEQVIPRVSFYQTPFTAVGGQYDHAAGYSEMWLATFDELVPPAKTKIISTHGKGNEPYAPNITLVLSGDEAKSQIIQPAGNAFTECKANKQCNAATLPLVSMYENRSCLAANPNSPDCPTTIEPAKALYAMAAAQTSDGFMLAGGQDRQLLIHHASSVGNCSLGSCQQCDNINGVGIGNCRINTGTACTDVNKVDVCLKNPIPDSWRDITTTVFAAVDPDLADDITGIAYVNHDTAYVTTTNFPAGTHPYTRTCAAGLIGRLWRVVGAPDVVANWKKISELTDACFFGVAAGTVDTPSTISANGPLRNYVWIAVGSNTAGNNGVWRVFDDFRTVALPLQPMTLVYDPPASCSGLTCKIFSVAASRNLGGDRPGAGVPTNLLMNGEFNARLNPAALDPNDINPDHWQVVGENNLENRMVAGVPTCDGNQRKKDVTFVANGTADASTAPVATPNDRAVVIEPGQGMASCSTPVTLSFSPTADAEVREATPGTNYGGTGTLYLDDSTDPDRDFLLKFDVADAQSRPITGATLFLQNDNDGGTPGGVFYPTTNAWTEAGVNWSNAPAPSGAAFYTEPSAAANELVQVPMSSQITGYGTYNFRVKTTSTQGVAYASKEHATLADPRLDVTVTGAGQEIDSAASAVGVTSVVNRVPLTTVEGKRYRLTGKYQVELLSGAQIPTARPANAYGGVLLSCAGASPPGGGVDCTMGTTRFLHNQNTGATGGFATIDTIISRQDSQLRAPLKGSTDGNTGGGLVLEIRCLATYGTRVTCDDFHIEEVNSPTVLPHDSYLVTAVGQGGLAAVSSDGAGAAPVFTLETEPGVVTNSFGGADATTVTAVDPAHVYAAGIGGAIAQRSAGSISGYLWAGTASPGKMAGPQAAAGWISTSCANSLSAGTSLCQRTPSAYGVNLDTANRRFSGRAWFGKTIQSGDVVPDQETVNLGACLQPAKQTAVPASPYVIGWGSCDNGTCTLNTAQSCTGPTEAVDCKRSCDPVNHWCYADTRKACFRDFDCYGRCAGDNGFLCLVEEDCQVGGAPELAGSSELDTQLVTLPKNRVQCDLNDSSVSACNSPGWLTFNPGEFSPPAPPAGLEAGVGQRNYCNGGGVCLNPANTSMVQGVAQFMTLAKIVPGPGNTEDYASRSWVSFRGDPVLPPQIGQNLYGCRSCSLVGAGPLQELNCNYCQDEHNYSCEPLDDPVPPDLTNYPYTCHYYCDGDRALDVPCRQNNDCLGIGATETCRAAGFCSLKDSSSTLIACSSSTICTTLGLGSCILGADCNPGGASCNQYGVNYDDTSGRFRGFAWNPVYGWLAAADLQQGTSRFIQTRLGDVYATGRIGAEDINQAPPSVCNATYLIASAGDIVNFCSNFVTGSAAAPTRTPFVTPSIPFASPENTFTNVLGRFDLVGMTTPATAGTVVNKYGTEIVTLSTTPLQLDGTYHIRDTAGPFSTPVDLKGRVYLVGTPGGTDSYTLAPSQQSDFQNKCGPSIHNAAGLLVVYGDLEIHNNLSYDSCAGLEDLRQLASLVVYVSGDLVIDNEVTNLVGTYYVQGTVRTASVINDGSNRYPLTVRGLMIAKSFVFGRKFAGTIDNPLPSELIIFDGRIQSNPLPGMNDFAAALPNTINTGP